MQWTNKQEWRAHKIIVQPCICLSVTKPIMIQFDVVISVPFVQPKLFLLLVGQEFERDILPAWFDFCMIQYLFEAQISLLIVNERGSKNKKKHWLNMSNLRHFTLFMYTLLAESF